jgi:hypothetical protein
MAVNDMMPDVCVAVLDENVTHVVGSAVHAITGPMLLMLAWIEGLGIAAI